MLRADGSMEDFTWGKKVMPRDVQPERVQVETEEDELNFIDVPPALRTLHLKGMLQDETREHNTEHVNSLLARHRWKKIGNDLVDTYDLSTLESEDEQLGHANLRANRQQLLEVTAKLGDVQRDIKTRGQRPELLDEHDSLAVQLEDLLGDRAAAVANVNAQYRRLLSADYQKQHALPYDPMFKHILKRKRRPAFTVRSLEKEVALLRLAETQPLASQLRVMGPVLVLAGVGAGWFAPQAFKAFTKSLKRVLIGTMITTAASVLIHKATRTTPVLPAKLKRGSKTVQDVNLLHSSRLGSWQQSEETEETEEEVLPRKTVQAATKYTRRELSAVPAAAVAAPLSTAASEPTASTERERGFTTAATAPTPSSLSTAPTPSSLSTAPSASGAGLGQPAAEQPAAEQKSQAEPEPAPKPEPESKPPVPQPKPVAQPKPPPPPPAKKVYIPSSSEEDDSEYSSSY